MTQRTSASNPYAWWWLTKTEDAHATAQSKIKLELEILYKALDADSELDVHLAASDFPSRIDLNFACPYAYWGARVLKSFDDLILAATTAESLGLRPGAAHMEKRSRCERSIRALFASAQGFRSIAVCVDDIKNGTDAATQARELMGPLPIDVGNGRRRRNGRGGGGRRRRLLVHVIDDLPQGRKRGHHGSIDFGQPRRTIGHGR